MVGLQRLLAERGENLDAMVVVGVCVWVSACVHLPFVICMF